MRQSVEKNPLKKYYVDSIRRSRKSNHHHHHAHHQEQLTSMTSSMSAAAGVIVTDVPTALTASCHVSLLYISYQRRIFGRYQGKKINRQRSTDSPSIIVDGAPSHPPFIVNRSLLLLFLDQNSTLRLNDEIHSSHTSLPFRPLGVRLCVQPNAVNAAFRPQSKPTSTSLSVDTQILMGGGIAIAGLVAGVGFLAFAESMGERAKERGVGLSDSMATKS